MKCKKNVTKIVTLGMVLGNLPIYSFANSIDNNSNKISQIKIKEDLQKSAQKAVKSGNVDTWITGLANMPTPRSLFTSAVIDGKIYCIGGYDNGSYFNKVEVYDPKTDTWETKASMPTARYRLSSSVVNGKIYCIGGYNGSSYLNKVEVYDPKTDTWETKSSMPTAREALASAVIDGKIYCIGGYNSTSRYLNKVEVYDPKTDTWDTSKAKMPTHREGLVSEVIDGKIYCIGGYNGSALNKVEVYDPKTDTWETKSSMPTSRSYFSSEVIDGKIYCIGGYNGSTSSLNKVEAYIPKEISPEEKAEASVEQAELSRDLVDIETARDLVNNLPESSKKDELQGRLDIIVLNLSLSPQSATANLDIYIKSENMLSLSLDTNSVTFDNFSGVEDMEKQNAVNLTISSSLPYKINAYLPTEIIGARSATPMDKQILNIRANGQSNYNTFTDLTTPVVLLDNQANGNNITHGIDLMLKGNIAHEKDVYKATIKLEAEQK